MYVFYVCTYICMHIHQIIMYGYISIYKQILRPKYACMCMHTLNIKMNNTWEQVSSAQLRTHEIIISSADLPSQHISCKQSQHLAITGTNTHSIYITTPCCL